MSKVTNWFKHAFNAFESEDTVGSYPSGGFTVGGGYSGGRPDKIRFFHSNEKSIVSAIYNRLAVDFASVKIQHVRLDDQDRFSGQMDSDLNDCLTLKANIDQGARAFRQDIAATLFDKGCIAIVPVDTSLNPKISGSYDIQSMRVGEIVQWYPTQVRVSLWNEVKGRRQELVLDKKSVAIVENPFYTVMNETSSTLQRLIRKLNILDAIDEQSGSGKLDLIIQLPYVIKSESRRQQAEKRREDIEFQLKGSKYGIAYTDGTEKITQLNRPAENNLQNQIEYLVDMLYGQLGLTPEIMNGTADEKTMLNYLNRTIEPVLDAVVESMKATFLTKTARTQKQSIEYFRDTFKLVPIASIAEIADKFTRNEILSSNEIRSIVGFKPSTDPKADKLVNSNMPAPSGPVTPGNSGPVPTDLVNQEGDSQNGS
jgi:hypothetical protein